MQTASLDGLTGKLELGRRLGRSGCNPEIPPPPWYINFVDNAEPDEDDRAPLPSQANELLDYFETIGQDVEAVEPL